jgi:DNA polymerase III subunit epsilon
LKSLRQVVLDTETTGLQPEQGHRVIEIGCVEIVDRRLTGRHLHLYFNPERDIDEGALAVHGLSRERLSAEPLFSERAKDILEFVQGAEILIHNAPFDVGFLNAELQRLKLEKFPSFAGGILDTLAMARELHPGKRNGLDALCERYGISNAHRKLHGALLDAELLADVYLAMTRGQDSLGIAGDAQSRAEEFSNVDWPPPGLLPVKVTDDEQEVHLAYLKAMEKDAKGPALWTQLTAV